MESLVITTARTASRSYSSDVAEICRTVGGSFSSSVFPYRSYPAKKLDGRVPASSVDSSAAHPIVDIYLTGLLQPAIPKTQIFGASRHVYDRYAYPPRKRERFRVGVFIAMLKRQITRTALDEEESPVFMCLRPSGLLAQESYHNSPSQGCARGKGKLIGSACGGSNIHLSEAIAILKRRQQQAISTDAYTFVEVLKRCSNEKNLPAGRQVHDCIIQSGMDKNPYVANTLLNVYVRCGRLQDARRVFDGLEMKTAVTWNIMIGGYAKSDHAEEALDVFHQMIQAGGQPGRPLCLSILKACASPLALGWGKELHAYIRHAGLESDTRLGTALVQMYAKCGCIIEARRLFDRTENRNIITWNILIGAYAKSGRGAEAYRLFLQMKQEGLVPDAYTYASILNASAIVGPLEWVTKVHRHALEAGLESDLRVGNALVHMYTKCGNIDDAQQVFSRMQNRDATTWTIMIGAHAERGCGVEAYRLFLQMNREGFIPDVITYLSILNVSASAGALPWVKEVHCHARRAGLESDLCVGGALVHMYAKIGSICDARGVFDRLQTRAVRTWNIMIGAYAEIGRRAEASRLFIQMKQEGFIPDAYTYASMLKASERVGDSEWVKEVHRQVLEAGLESDLRVGTALVDMYAKCGNIDDAQLVFSRMENRDATAWTILIKAHAERGCGVEAYRLFLQMDQEGFIPDVITYLSILNASASAGALEWLTEVHGHARKAGLESDSRVGGALIHMYAKSGRIGDARVVFDKLNTRAVRTWNIMIGAYAEIGLGAEAYRLFVQMKQEGFIPDAYTYASILNASASAGALEWVREVHRHALEAGLASDLRVGTALVHMYSKSGSLGDARLVFNRMEKRDVFTWTAMIGGLGLHGQGNEALELFRTMTVDRVKPNETSFVAVLSACCHAGLVDDGNRLFLAMTQDFGIEPSVVHCNCVVDLLGRAGHLEEAKLFIDKMPVQPDAVTWKALLGACRTYGNVGLGEFAAEQVLKLEPRDSAAYVVLSNIYAAAGKWEKVSSVRTMMQERGVWKEPGRSWIEVDDKIHEFIVGDKSHPEAKAIYALLNILTEKLKAEGYVPDTKLVLQDINEEDKELVLCSHSEKLAIAYGLLRIPAGEPIRVYKNLRVCSDCHSATKFISKVCGRDIIARDANRFHHFKDGACSCGDYW